MTEGKLIQRLLIIAGAGSYPRLLVEGAKKAGVPQVDVLAIKGATRRATYRIADHVHWESIGHIARGVKWVGSSGYDGAIFAGQVNPLSLFRSRFDAETKAWLNELPAKNAHTIFGKLIEKLTEAGAKILPASLYLDENMPGVGALTTRALTPAEESDAKYAAFIARDMGVHDVGQTVVVKSGMVMAVEAFEGTNKAIRRGGRLGGAGALVFKAAREGHDMRFDIPVVGLKTLKVMHAVGIKALVFQAHRLVLLDREKVIRYANRYGIALVGVESGLSPAPLRP